MMEARISGAMFSFTRQGFKFREYITL